tara:strand:- start:865 stop:1983 length:1119 start_codon:yes stop_codon:yes gene_type:complete
MIELLKNWLWSLFTKEKPVRKKRKQREKAHYGAHYYLGDLLDNLDYTFNALKNTKKFDVSSYKLFSKIGISVFNSDFETAQNESNGYFKPDKTPAFGAAAFGRPSKDEQEKHKDSYWLSVFTFRKIEKMVNVQPSNHQTFAINLFYQCPKTDKQIQEELYASIDDKGNVTPLKYCKPVERQVGKGRKATSFVRMEWDFPYVLSMECRERNISIEEAIRNYFWNAVNCSMAQESGISIRVKKGRDALTFAIDMERTPYFFNDRQKVVNENGNTKPIFHIVRGHFRKNGAFVKTHFRGLRKFKWNDYSVLIGLSGLHYSSYFKLTGSAVLTDNDHGIPPEKLVSNEALGLALEKHIETGAGKDEMKKIIEDNRV